MLFLPIAQAEIREKELLRLFTSISKRIFKGVEKQLIPRFFKNSDFLSFFSLRPLVKINLKHWLLQKKISVEINLKKFKLILELFKLIEILNANKNLTFFEKIKIFQLYKKVLFELIFETNLTKEEIEEILDLPLY